MHSQRLPNAQVEHNLLAATRDSISSNIPVQPLDLPALTTTRITQPTKDLTRLPGTELKGDRTLRFQASNRASKLKHGFRLVHFLALVDEGLEPGIGGFDLPRHVG